MNDIPESAGQKNHPNRGPFIWLVDRGATLLLDGAFAYVAVSASIAVPSCRDMSQREEGRIGDRRLGGDKQQEPGEVPRRACRVKS